MITRMKPGVMMLFLGVLLAQSCAYNKQTVAIKPVLQPGEPVILAADKSVALKVVDGRTTPDFGRRVGAYGAGELISTQGDAAGAIREKIAGGLQRCGFAVEGSSGQASRSMHVEIRAIEYNAGIGMWTVSTKTAAALKVTCRNNEKTYENLYRAETEKRGMSTAFAETNEILINRVVSEALDKILQDKELLTFLSR